MGGEPPPGYSSGGMRTKLVAAASPPRPAVRWRSPTATRTIRLPALENGARCTWFLRRARRPFRPQALDRRRAGSARRAGGGRRRGARARRRPFAAAGRRRGVEGAFQRGDPVVVRGPDGRALARGLSAYASVDADRIAGHRTDEIEAILGWRGRDEIIHRDDLVLL